MAQDKSNEINEQVEFGLEEIQTDETISIKLKDFLYTYKAIEEFRRFFHQTSHYEILDDVHTYIGNKEGGAYSILNNLYLKVLDKYLPKEIIKKIENNKLTNPKFPYYYHLKRDTKLKLASAGNIEPSTYKLIKDMGYEIYKRNGNWIATNYNSEFIADNPIELLGLITLYRSKGDKWQVGDDIIEDYIKLDANNQ